MQISCPLSQSELRKKPCDFLERVLSGRPPSVGEVAVGADLIEKVTAGGYPEAIARKSSARRQKWFQDHVRAVIERDVRDISHIEYIRHMPKLLRVLATHSSQLANYSSMGASLGIGHVTTQRYTDVLAHLFPHTNPAALVYQRTETDHQDSKLHFLDSGLLSALRNLSHRRGCNPIGRLSGHCWKHLCSRNCSSSRAGAPNASSSITFRDRYDNEVDIV